MESKFPMIGVRRKLSVSCGLRVLLHKEKVFQLTVVLICAYFCLCVSGPCSTNGKQSVVEYDACEPCRDKYHMGFQDVYVGDTSLDCTLGLDLQSPDDICSDSNLLCFPSTLSVFLPEQHTPDSNVVDVSPIQPDIMPLESVQVQTNSSWSFDHGMFKLLSGQAVSCSLNSEEGIPGTSSLQGSNVNQKYVSFCGGPLVNQKCSSSNLNEKTEMIKSGFLDSSLSPIVKISPPILDWGQKHLYLPSFAFLTVANTQGDSTLYLYEPFTTNRQFFPCNSSEVFLGPGEVASICFVFLPTLLGMSLAQLILQTSSGGFLIQAKGFAVESPYGIQPLVGLDVSSGGRWSRNLSLSNPFDETLYVEEVTAWISVSVGNSTHLVKAVCKIENSPGSDEGSFWNMKEWLDVESGEADSPLIAMRPHRNWGIVPGSSESIVEVDFTYKSVRKIFGAFCVQLQRSSQDKADSIMVPLEAELGGEAANYISDSVSTSLQTIVSCHTSETAVVILSLRNGSPHLLNVVKISSVGKGSRLFQVRYIEGLILFPRDVTQVAVVSYVCRTTALDGTLPESPDINLNCKLVILTNDSSNSQIEVSCNDIIRFCSKLDSYAEVEHGRHFGKVEHVNAKTGSLGSSRHSQALIKAMEAAVPDELVLKNWKSQGAASGMSVLQNHEVFFPMVQVGSYHSEWVTVKNPSEQPVLMQLILNSAKIVDKCRDADGHLQPSSSGNLVLIGSEAPKRYGFSLAEGALTEAFVHPFGAASFGPILFHPSGPCGWRSSALVKNNLSGVEWLSLHGFGGSSSLVIFEGSNPVQSLEFKFKLLCSLNFSPEMFHLMEEIKDTCSQPLSKELYAENTGDLPLEVRRIQVSGTECGLDGFLVHACGNFTLGPGESTKLQISYHADFSAIMVQRDLELALATGILVIPMKASVPQHMLNLCKKAIFWIRLKKISLAILLSAFLILVVLFCITPQFMALGSQDYSSKSGKRSTKIVGKSSGLHFNQKNTEKNALSSEPSGLLRSIGEEETITQESINGYSEGQGVAPGNGIIAQHFRLPSQNPTEPSNAMDTQKEMALESCIPPENGTVESPDVQEASGGSKLTVRIGKEKGRRRRKKKGSGAVLSGIFEVSSSQSGNSTPSSPLSPVTSSTPKRSWPMSSDADQYVEARSHSGHVAQQQCEKSSDAEVASKANIVEPAILFSAKHSSENCYSLAKEEPYAPKTMPGKAVLRPPATFPCISGAAPNVTSSSFSASTSTIAPHARAPGSNLYNQNIVKAEAVVAREDQFKYDIWGDHLFGPQLVGRSNEVSTMTSSASEWHSDSFFARGPQTVITKSQPKAVSCSR